LLFWQGDPDDPTNTLVTQSDPINLSYEKDRVCFYEACVDTFGELPWLREVLEYLSRNHDKNVAKEKEQHHKEELQALPDYRRIEGTDYLVTAEGFAMEVEGHGAPELRFLSNFTASIVEELVEDDGNEETCFYELEAWVGSKVRRFEIPATAFGGMNWMPKHLGARATIEPPFSRNKDHVRRAIVADSTDVREVRAYAHTGWRRIEGRWGYVHADGVIFSFQCGCLGDGGPGCRVCQTFDGRVALRGKLARRAFPAPVYDAKLREAVRSTFALWELAADEVAIPLDAAAKRAAMGRVDFSVQLAGPTGEGKTALSLLLLNLFGRGLREEDSISFESTENAIEAEAFLLKDQLHLLDDYLGTPEHKRTLARIGRTTANNTGRARMKPDGTLAGERPPRALVLTTGEDLPLGESLSTRILVLRVPENGGVDFSPDALINECQEAAKNGVYRPGDVRLHRLARWALRRHSSRFGNRTGKVSAGGLEC
jgi:hypothetical protein